MNEQQQQMEDKVCQQDRNLETRMDEMASRMSSQFEEMKSVEGKVNKIMETLEMQNTENHEAKFLKLVEKLDSKLLTNTKTQFEGNIQLEKKIEGLHKKLDDKVDHISTQLEKEKKRVAEVQETISTVVCEIHNEDKAEEEELETRKTNVIIHGMYKSLSEVQDRIEDDTDQVAIMLQELIINKIIRLGKKPTSSNSVMPRSMKVVLKSERDKIKLLQE
jgi:hypothetical protein